MQPVPLLKLERPNNGLSGLLPGYMPIGLCVAMDQKLTLSNLLSRMPLICGESFNSVAKTLLLLFVPKARGVGVFGSLILARVLERI
jgi:hypothetical protein